jgi:hypothetical protein
LPERPALPSIRVKLPSEGGRDFLQRYAPRIAEKGLTIPTANLRAVGSRIRLTLELKSGEVVSGEAVVESHLTGPKPALVVRFASLDEGSIVFPFAGQPAASAGAAPPPAATPAPVPAAAARPAPGAPRQESGELEDLFGPEDAAVPRPPEPAPGAEGPPGAEGHGGEPSRTQARGEVAGRLPGPPDYAEEPRPVARRRGRLLAAVVVLVAVVAVGVFAAVRALQGTSAPAPRAPDEVAMLLAAADRGIAAGRLSGPEGALHHLVRARAVAPGDGRVRERLKLLADTLEAFAARALDRGDAREARAHLEAAEQADPGRPSLAEKRARLEALPAPVAPGR